MRELVSLLWTSTLVLLSLPAAPADPPQTDGSGNLDETPESAEWARQWGGHAWILFPGNGRVFDPLLADPREACIRAGIMVDDESDRFLDAQFGGDLPILHIVESEDRGWSLTARGVITGRFEYGSESFDLQNTDYLGGGAVGYRRGDDAFEIFIYHRSAHLGDEIVERGERERIDFGENFIRLLWAHRFGDLRFYGGPAYRFSGTPDTLGNRTHIQFGGEYRFELGALPLYAAADVQLRDEHDWHPNVATQLGLELGGGPSRFNRARVFLEYFNGHSNMGQFYNEDERYLMIGLAYCF